MSDNVKVAGIITSGFVCGILAVVYTIEPSVFIKDLVIAFGGVFGAFFGLPIAARAISKLVR